MWKTLLVLVVFVAGGPLPGWAQGAPATHPCSLVTQGEVETAMGKGATMTESRNPRTGFDECRLQATGSVKVVVIVVHPADQFAAAKKQLMTGGTDVKDAKGLGEDAFVGRTVGYNIRKGGRYVQVFGSLLNENDAANDTATRYLAERAASRL